MVCVFTALFSSVNFADDRGTLTEGHHGVTKSGHAVTFGAWCFSPWTLPGGGSDLCGKLTQPKHSSGPGASLEMNVTDDTQQTGTPFGSLRTLWEMSLSGTKNKAITLCGQNMVSTFSFSHCLPFLLPFSSRRALARTTGQEL